MNRQQTIEAILAASRRPCPPIVTTKYYRAPNGHSYHAMGGFPIGIKPEDCDPFIVFGYYDARHNTTYGKMYKTEQDAIDDWQANQDRNIQQFREAMEQDTDERLAELAAYHVAS